MKQATPHLQSLWNLWQEKQDQEAGDELVTLYMPLVEYHVKRVSATLPQNVSRQEIKSLGLMGLVDAINKFDYERDLKFDTYASFRIRGAIMDGLRKEDWLPRSIRDKAKQIETIAEQLEQSLGRLPRSEEIAQELGITSGEVERTLKDSLFANTISIEEKATDEDQYREGIGYIVPDEQAVIPEEQLITSEKVDELAYAIQQLNEKEQLVISLFYQKELTLTEIGEVLELSTSRISQIHSRAIFKLREFLKRL